MNTRHQPMTPDSMTIRFGYGLLFFGLLGLIDGTIRVGSHPAWPSPVVWAIIAAVAAGFQIAAIFSTDSALRGTALLLAFAAVASRGLGFTLAPLDQTINSAAVGAYIISVGAILLVWARWKDEGREA